MWVKTEDKTLINLSRVAYVFIDTSDGMFCIVAVFGMRNDEEPLTQILYIGKCWKDCEHALDLISEKLSYVELESSII